MCAAGMAHVAHVVHNAGIDAIRPITAYRRRTKGTNEKNFDTGRAFLLVLAQPPRGHHPTTTIDQTGVRARHVLVALPQHKPNAFTHPTSPGFRFAHPDMLFG